MNFVFFALSRLRNKKKKRGGTKGKGKGKKNDGLHRCYKCHKQARFFFTFSLCKISHHSSPSNFQSIGASRRFVASFTANTCVLGVVRREHGKSGGAIGNPPNIDRKQINSNRSPTARNETPRARRTASILLPARTTEARRKNESDSETNQQFVGSA